MAAVRPCDYSLAMPDRKRANRRIFLFDLPRRVDAREILALIRDVEKPFFRISGPAPLVDLFKGMLKAMGVPAGRIAPP
jgi:hypothetical protein